MSVKVLVIGSGLIGITAAHFLLRRGHEVTVVDQGPEPACATSFANGGLLTPSMADPWNTPGIWSDLLVSSFRGKPIVKVRLRALPSMGRWIFPFLLASRSTVFRRNALNNLRLAVHSLDVLRSLTDETGISYSHRKCGTLRVFRDGPSFRRACETTARHAVHGLGFRHLNVRQAVEIEPALNAVASDLLGGIYCTTDEIGDARQFCIELARWLQARGAEFRFHTEVRAFEVRSGRIVTALTNQGTLCADSYVAAAGIDSANLLHRIGIRMPIRPLKGYSMTLGGLAAARGLSIPIVDDTLHVAVVPIGSDLRIAGFAEFAGFDCGIDPRRIAALLAVLKRFMPDIETELDMRRAQAWCGLRPLSADGVPIIGRTPISNLFVNVGHGPLGWTMAAGSGELLADLLSNERCKIDPVPFALQRFSGPRDV
jgi:D-amino-acid dehydrogenase